MPTSTAQAPSCKFPSGVIEPVIDSLRCEAKGPCVPACPFDVLEIAGSQARRSPACRYCSASSLSFMATNGPSWWMQKPAEAAASVFKPVLNGRSDSSSAG